jgi:hypothetical protein
MGAPFSRDELAKRLLAYVQGALARLGYGSTGLIEDMYVIELLRDQGMLRSPDTMDVEARELLLQWFPLGGEDTNGCREEND